MHDDEERSYHFTHTTLVLYYNGEINSVILIIVVRSTSE